MKIKDLIDDKAPSIIIIPMIDIMFFLLVFFMLSTLNMIDARTIEVELPKTQTADAQLHTTYFVTITKDGNLYLDDEPITEDELIARSMKEFSTDSKFSIIINADKSVKYDRVINIMDNLRYVGIYRFGLATENVGDGK